MVQGKSVLFANFVCRFGDKVLLDFAKEVVFPAFLAGGQRKYGASRYIIQDTSIVRCGENANDLVIVGRFVKDTVLEREQTLENGKLVKNRATMQSAPSALFALVVDTHKLMYLPETSQAPHLSAFRATASRILKEQHTGYVDHIHLSQTDKTNKETKKAIFKRLPYPSLEIVPLSSMQNFANFLNQFKVLEQIRIDLIDTNNETDGLQLIHAAREVKGLIDAKGVTINMRNNSGLSSLHAQETFTNLAEDGNTKLTFTGKDMDGANLTGDNDSFRLAVRFDTDSNDPKVVGGQLWSMFKKKIQDGLLKIQAPDRAAIEKVAQLAAELADTD